MSSAPSDDERPLDPAAARVVARIRLMMMISGVTTLIAVAAVIGVIGYRVFRQEGSAPAAATVVPAPTWEATRAPAEVLALLPKGARVTATAVAGDRLVVTLDASSGPEVRTFDLRTLRPTGRLRFGTEP
jgi:hypothetical protein